MHNRRQGFTLFELLIAAYVLLIGMCGTLLLFINSMTSTQSSWDITVASTHAQHVLEEIQNKATLSEIVRTDWKKWIESQDIRQLPQEEVQVIFPQITANPLDIQVFVQWQRKGGTKNISIYTKLTR